MQITIEIPEDEYFLLMRLNALKGYGLKLNEGESQLETARKALINGLVELHSETLTTFIVYLSRSGHYLVNRENA